MNVLLLALAAVNPLSYPSYEQKVVAEFASPAEAAAATCEVASLPDDAQPDAQDWRHPPCPPDGIPSMVAAPIKTRGSGPKETALRELLRGADHARYVVYDFDAARDGKAVLRLNASPKYRSPTIYLNGVKSAFTGDRQEIAVRKGLNRLLLRADAVCGGVLHRSALPERGGEMT